MQEDYAVPEDIEGIVVQLLKDEQLVKIFQKFSRDEITAGEAMQILLRSLPSSTFDRVPLPILMHELTRRASS